MQKGRTPASDPFALCQLELGKQFDPKTKENSKNASLQIKVGTAGPGIFCQWADTVHSGTLEFRVLPFCHENCKTFTFGEKAQKSRNNYFGREAQITVSKPQSAHVDPRGIFHLVR